MIKCTKCQIEKEENEFYTYWHSTQLTYRTRKICRECTSKHMSQYKKARKLNRINIQKEIDLSQNPDYQQCVTCNKYKHKNVFLTYRNSSYYNSCPECRRKMNRDARLKQLERKGGGDMVYVEPGKFIDEFQRRQTEEVLRACGYLYNANNGIWYKEPWKTKDGEFPLLKKNKYKKGNKVTLKKIDEILYYRKFYTNWTINKIASKVDLSNTTVWKILKKYEEK